MSVLVTQNGSRVRVTVSPREVVAFGNVAGRLVVTFDDDDTQDIGAYPSGDIGPVPTYLMDFRLARNAAYVGAML